jgi:ABC-type Fe3+/spermidine/putrescine transport system ATPase subunit
MFQDYSLFPHLSVARNIGFGLRMIRWTRERERARVGEMLALVRMPGFAGREVHTLSGGEQQRVALARSLAPEPRMLMLDEPLGALDAALRMDLLGEISGILRGIGMTAVYVTHDQEEAMTIADRVALLDRGRIMQVGSPDELISRPACAFVCSFLKLGTVIPARRTRQGGGWLVRTDLGDFLLRDGISGKPLLLVRPEAVLFARRPGAVKVNARILSRTPLPDGASIRMALLGRSGRGHPLDLHTGSAGKIPPGSTVRNVWIDPRSCLLVAADA